MRVKSLSHMLPGFMGALSLLLCNSLVSAVPNVEGVLAIKLEYQQNQRKNAPTPEPFFGDYLGSGTGRISGQLNGAVHWDLYEDQSREDLHRVQLVGVVVKEDGSRVPFEGLGFYKSREGGYWDLTASFSFDCKDSDCPWHQSQPLLSKGTVKSGEWIHRARLYSVSD